MTVTLRKIIVAVIVVFLSLIGLSTKAYPESAQEPEADLTAPDRADYTDLGWTEAFAAANDKLSREYAFTD